MSVATLAKTRRDGNPGRSPQDFYRTPRSAIDALLRVEQFTVDVWEPACGDGAIAVPMTEAGYQVVSTDLVDRGFGTAGVDFLSTGGLLARSVITNPPFNLIDEFALHALNLGAEKIAFFARSGWLEGRKRYDTLWSVHPPIRIWQFCGRQTLWRGDDPNPRTTGGALAFAWFIFERGYKGDPAVKWLR
jgi:hypothetical protein